MKKLLLITFLFLGLGGYSQTIKSDTIVNKTNVKNCCQRTPLTPEQKRKSRRFALVGIGVFVTYVIVGVLKNK